MEFECQKSTEVLKIPIDCFEDCHPRAESFETWKPILDRCSNNGVSGSFSSKHLSCNDGLPNFCRRSITDLPVALISKILNCLDPKELGIVSCVSTVLNKLAAENGVWKEAYCQRWGVPVVPAQLSVGISDEKSWKELFVEREFRTKSFLGRYSIDALYGPTEAVRTVFVLASAKLIFSSGYDTIVRVWSLEDGLSIASSRRLGCTIRAVAADKRLLVVGGTDGFIQGWRAVEGLPHLFDVRCFESAHANSEFKLWGHEGPITSLALDITRIYSGSWDMTLRIWDRSSLECLNVLRHGDWIWSLVPHDTTVATASGSDVYIWDWDTNSNCGTLLTVIRSAHVGNIYSLARSHTGDFIFTGGEDGAIHMFELVGRAAKTTNLLKVATWIPHSGPVYSLAFEFPWLISASSDGKLSLIDVRKLLKSRIRHSSKNFCVVEPPTRMLHGFGPNLFSVDVGADRIVCGGEEGIVRIWNFSEALEIQRRVQTVRGIRLEKRMRRRKLQLEMLSSKDGKNDQCSVVAKKNPVHGDRSTGVWHSKRGMSWKLKS